MPAKSSVVAIVVAACLITEGSLMAGGEGASLPPRAASRPVETNYFGTIIVDPYRWMEDVRAPDFVTWTKSQSDYARRILNRLPQHHQILQRVSGLADARPELSDLQPLGTKLYYLKRGPKEDGFKLFVRDGLKAQEQLLIDPVSSTSDPHVSIDYYTPSPNGRYIAYGTSANGSENSILRVWDVAAHRDLPDRIDRGRRALPQWRPDGRSFFYWREQALPKGAPASATHEKKRSYLHILGSTPTDDPAVFGYGVSKHIPFAADDSPYVVVVPGCAYAFGFVAHGTQAEKTIYVAPLNAVVGPDTPWKKFVDVGDAVSEFDVHGGDVFLISHKGAPRSKVMRVRLDALDLSKSETVVAPSEAVVRSVTAAEDALYVRLLHRGLGRIVRVPYDGSAPQPIPLPFDGAVDEPSASVTAPGIFFDLATWVRAPAVYRYDPEAARIADTGLLPPSPIDTSGYESTEVLAKGRDGVAIPLSIAHRKGLVLDGSHPTWLSGYGSYGVALDPAFQPRRLAWLESGGVFAVAHVRGGGEYGEEWHVAGMKKTKQNSVDDFIACAQYLIDHKYTSPAHLAGEGGSAGGLTIGGAITQRPDLFAAALIRVGFSDAVRIEETPIGRANAREFGSAMVEQEFKYLLAMSPYHHVKDGVRYPAVLLTGAVNDSRIPLWQPAKMTARLQAATASNRPVLLRIADAAGHGFGSGTASSEYNAELADCYAFLLWQLTPEDKPRAGTEVLR